MILNLRLFIHLLYSNQNQFVVYLLYIIFLKHFRRRSHNLKLPDSIRPNLYHIDSITSPGNSDVMRVDKLVSPGINQLIVICQVKCHSLKILLPFGWIELIILP